MNFVPLIDSKKIATILEMAADMGKSTGIFSTARLTHATPAALYAHAAVRDWEADANLPVTDVNTGAACRGSPSVVKDIARQLIAFSNAIQRSVDLLQAAGRLDDTLIIVTADHSHRFTIAGYPSRGNNILGLVREVPNKDGDPPELRSLRLVSRSGRGTAERLRLADSGGAGAVLVVKWLPALQLPARIDRRGRQGSLMGIELDQHAAAALPGWPLPGSRSGNHRRIDAADFGNMDHDPVVRNSEALDVRSGWRNAHPPH